MNRKVLMGTLGAAALALAFLGGRGLRADDKEGHHVHAEFEKCARACTDCCLACESCYRHCLHLTAKGQSMHARTVQTCNDCGDFCALAAKVTARGGPTAATTCDACAKVCDTCGAACEKFPDDEHMKTCAKACRDCAKACREMLKHVGHAEEAEPGKEGK